MSKSSQVAESLPYLHQSPNLSVSSKWAIVACSVAAIAALTICALSIKGRFGTIGSISSTASLAGGGVLACGAIGGIIWIAVTSSKNHKLAVQLAAEVFANNTKKHHEKRYLFLNTAKERLEKKSIVPYEFPDSNEIMFKENAEKAFEEFDRPATSEPPIQVIKGGEHDCVATDRIPGVIFKKERGNSSNANDYVKTTEKARKICIENDLYLLYVPKCRVVDFQASVVMQEKVEVCGESCEYQENLYEWAVSEPELEMYAKQLFRQLAIFICLMGFADVKYDNIPIMKDGRIALFDIDSRSAISGLTVGRADKRNQGLFKMIPIEWFDEFIDIAKQHLTQLEFEQLQTSLPQLKEKALKRKQRREEMAAFYAKHDISLPTQLLVFNKNLFDKYEKGVVFFAYKAIQRINEQIASLSFVSNVAGRKISISTRLCDPFYNEIANSPFFKSKDFNYEEFKKIESKVLEALKEQGYLFSYKTSCRSKEFSYSKPEFSVIC